MCERKESINEADTKCNARVGLYWGRLRQMVQLRHRVMLLDELRDDDAVVRRRDVERLAPGQRRLGRRFQCWR